MTRTGASGRNGCIRRDYDADGWLDIFKTNFEDDVPDLYRNGGRRDLHLQDVRRQTWLQPEIPGLGGGFFDYDNDGWPDIFIANGHVYPELENHHHPESQVSAAKPSVSQLRQRPIR